MKVTDPGHTYSLGVVDGDTPVVLRFVKREGRKFPGNRGTQPGTILQEVLRACLDRINYLDRQISCDENDVVRRNIISSIEALERRAARRHGREAPPDPVHGQQCLSCLHVGCDGSSCHAARGVRPDRDPA